MSDNRVINEKPFEECKRQINEAVCIDTSRVYDSCADKDCLSDLRVYFTDAAQQIVDAAASVRCRGCEIINAIAEVEKVPFNKGFYSVDITYYFRVSVDCLPANCAQAETVCGLCMFTKKCILYGSEGSVKVFTSEYVCEDIDKMLPPTRTNPRAKVQVAEPICLDARLCHPCDCCNNISDMGCVPYSVRRCFCGQFVQSGNTRAVRVTIGLFSIIQLERDVQMLIPAYSFCVPEKECTCNTEDPCDAFRRIRFPVSAFFPPDADGPDCNEDSFPTHCGCCGA